MPVRRADKKIRDLLGAYETRPQYLAALVFTSLLVATAVSLGLRAYGIAATHTEQVLDCHYAGEGAHAHDASCYDGEGNLVCPLVERDFHAHDDSCYTETRELACGLDESEDHIHTDACYETVRTLTCGQQEVAEVHTHGPGCFKTVTVDDGDNSTEPTLSAQATGDDASTDALEAEGTADVANAAQSFTEEFTDGQDDLVLRVDVKAPEGALPEGTTMQAELVDPNKMEADAQTALDNALTGATGGKLVDLQAVDITFRDEEGTEVEPQEQVTVTFTSPLLDTEDEPVIVHVESEHEAQARAEEQGKRTYELEAQVIDALDEDELARREVSLAADELAFDAGSLNTYVLAVTTIEHTLTASDGATVTVTVEAPAAAGIPADAQLLAEEVAPDSAAYEDYRAQAVGTLGAEERNVALARFFDITILDAAGNELQPQAPVNVRIELADAAELDEPDAGAQVVHFGDEVEVVPATEEGGTTSFDATGFSVYGVVYTVDFHYGVDGETIDISLTGGDSISLRELLERLEVAEDEEALDKLMADVEEVTFSNPELIDVVEVKKEAIAWDLAAADGHRIVYPLGMTQEQVLALSTKRYQPGDWAIISLAPFNSTETLTVKLATDESIVITVTDAQDAPMNADATVQTISNPAGTTIDLFDYWIEDPTAAGRSAWPGLNEGWGGHNEEEGGQGWNLNGDGNFKGINSSTDDSVNGHALKFSPAWESTVYNGCKYGDHYYYDENGTFIGKVSEPWRNLNRNGRDGLNSYTGDADPFQHIVSDVLDGGYPKLTDNGTIGTTGESLAYLFDPNIDHAGKASYSGVNNLLYVDSNGYYTYDSRDYAAQFNQGTSDFTLTEQTSDNSEIRGFWPFGTQNFWSGLHMQTEFSMPQNGEVLNPAGAYMPMQFEFSGDDDTWIYVDGVLVGDGGGIHNRTEIDVNFKEGTVTITGKKGGDHAGTFEEVRYLDDIFNDAGKYDDSEWVAVEGSSHKTFAPNTYHTFDFFYLERGGGESNLYIHYNLVSTADFTAHKALQGYEDHKPEQLTRDQFQFELVGLDGQYQATKQGDVWVVGAEPVGATKAAIMPTGGGPAGAGTVASPKKVYDETIPGWVYTTGVSEDGNINFGTAEISEAEMHACDQGYPSVYRYMIREIIPDDAKNEQGQTWAAAKAAGNPTGHFSKDGITYDSTVYYMEARVTSWTETDSNGAEHPHYGLAKTYYTDDSYTVRAEGTAFASFVNEHTVVEGHVDFTKVNVDGDPLQGAKFTLYKDILCRTAATDVSGTELKDVASDAQGKVSFTHVRAGTYYLKESVAPANYHLSDTVYKVTIVEDGTGRESTIVALNDESNTPVERIVNYGEGKITVVKEWQDERGAKTAPGAESVNVKLKRKAWTTTEPTGSAHNVTLDFKVRCYGWDGTPDYGKVTTATVFGDTVVIDWYDNWSNNFNYVITVGDRTLVSAHGDHQLEGTDFKFEKIDLGGKTRRLTIWNVDGDVTVDICPHHSDELWKNEGHRAKVEAGANISGSGDAEDVLVEDATFNASSDHTATLNAGSNWAHAWSIGGTDSTYAGRYDYPETDELGRPYQYYVVELGADGQELARGDSVTSDFVLHGYSANNEEGVTDEGVITVYNRRVTTEQASIKIYKVIDGTAEPLPGAKFQLTKVDENGNVPADESERYTSGELEVNETTGELLFDNLTAGRYKLEETVVPDGYVCNEGPYFFTVLADGSTTLENTGHSYTQIAEKQDEDNAYVVENTPGAELPAAGGPGTVVLQLVGGVLLVGGSFVLARRRWA